MLRPQIPDCYDPIEQERSRDLAYTARIMRRPRCLCCGAHILTETYLDLGNFGIKGYACEKCVEANTSYTEDLEDNT